MKKIIMMLLLAILATACQKKVDIGAITLGETYDETIQSLEREESRVERKDDGSVIGEGEIYVLDMCFDSAICEFENNKLTKVSLFRKFSTLSDTSIQKFKQQMRTLCGDGYSDTESMVTGYGIEDENNGCIGGIKVAWNDYEDCFFVVIRLAK